MIMVPFENIPSSLWAIITPWVITLGLLWYDFSAGGYHTNPILLFGFPVIVTILLMPKQNLEIIRDALGLYFPTIMDKLLNIVGIFIGAGVGYGFYLFLTRGLSIIPLYFIPELTQYVATTGDTTSLFIVYITISIGEEFFCILFAKIAANNLSGRFNIGTLEAILFGSLIARAFWSSLHIFSYASAGIAPFFVAWTLGTMFTMAAIGVARLTGKPIWYFVLPAIAAHTAFNLPVAMHLCFLW